MRRLLLAVLVLGLLGRAEAAVSVRTDESSSVLAATTTGAIQYVAEFSEAHVFVQVTAASGTDETLDITVQTAPTQDGPWVEHPWAQTLHFTGTGSGVTCFPWIGAYLRVIYTIDGTLPSFTVTSKYVLK